MHVVSIKRTCILSFVIVSQRAPAHSRQWNAQHSYEKIFKTNNLESTLRNLIFFIITLYVYAQIHISLITQKSYVALDTHLDGDLPILFLTLSSDNTTITRPSLFSELALSSLNTTTFSHYRRHLKYTAPLLSLVFGRDWFERTARLRRPRSSVVRSRLSVGGRDANCIYHGGQVRFCVT